MYVHMYVHMNVHMNVCTYGIQIDSMRRFNVYVCVYVHMYVCMYFHRHVCKPEV